MTEMTDATLDAALASYDVPPPRTGFADGIIAGAASPVTPEWRRPATRGPWARRGRLGMLSVVALMTTAGAAAAGWFGQTIGDLPVIRNIATVIPEAVKAKPSPKPAPAIASKPEIKPAPVLPPAIKSEPVPVVDPPLAQPQPKLDAADMASVRREAHVERITSRAETMLNRRDERRAARGLPVDSQRERDLLAKVKALGPGTGRRAALIEMREIQLQRHNAMVQRCARLAERGLTPPMCQRLSEIDARRKTRQVRIWADTAEPGASDADKQSGELFPQ